MTTEEENAALRENIRTLVEAEAKLAHQALRNIIGRQMALDERDAAITRAEVAEAALADAEQVARDATELRHAMAALAAHMRRNGDEGFSDAFDWASDIDYALGLRDEKVPQPQQVTEAHRHAVLDGFRGLVTRWSQVGDERHGLWLVWCCFDDGSEHPYVVAADLHEGGSRPKLLALSSAVHVLQNIGEQQWEVEARQPVSNAYRFDDAATGRQERDDNGE